MSASKMPSNVSTDSAVGLAANELTTNSPSIADMRIASIKAGLIGAGGVAIAASLVWIIAITLALPFLAPTSVIEWLINIAVALTCGFFFGVTYRYIVRQDDNLHLGSGAVGAFAFVRALAQIEAAWSDTFTPLFWLLLTGESFLWFAVARYALDWAITRKIIEPLD